MKTLFLFVGLILSAFASPSGFFAKYDLSGALQPKTRLLGFVGPDYQRLNIEFQSVKKSSKSNPEYLVAGKTEVKSSRCLFSGWIHFKKIETVARANMHYGVDDEMKSSGLKEEGTLIGDYEFKETPKEKNCGVFKGSMRLNYYIDRDGRFHYDDIESSSSDGFKNNQYRGTWTSYASSKPKVANWGEYRIPDSGDLDIGAGEFGPNPKYRKQGWD